jgi:hypothetical protein
MPSVPVKRANHSGGHWELQGQRTNVQKLARDVARSASMKTTAASKPTSPKGLSCWAALGRVDEVTPRGR